MTSAAKKILDDALALPEEERRLVGEAILDSVAVETEEDVARAWDEEVLHRIEAAERGDTVSRDWDEVRAEFRRKYTQT